MPRRSMVTAKKGSAQAGLLADRPSSGDFNPPPHGYTVHSTSTIVYEIWYYLALDALRSRFAFLVLRFTLTRLAPCGGGHIIPRLVRDLARCGEKVRAQS